jgi:adenosylcobinamide-GDP ribazoletransferase
MNKLSITWFSFWYAIAFLTRIPAVNLSAALKKNNHGISQGSLYFYPVVGLVIGALLILLFLLTSWSMDTHKLINEGFNSRHILMAAFILTAWSLLTGGLHLDGLADAADAWVGGYGDKQRTLDIMKDPTIGPMGVMLVVLVLLIKFAALVVLLDQASAWLVCAGLLLVPMLARFTILPLFFFTPYVREKGLGSQLKENIRPNILILVSCVCCVLSVLLAQQKAILIVLLAMAILLWARNMMMERIGGTTGDTAGALIEVQEALLLSALVL